MVMLPAASCSFSWFTLVSFIAWRTTNSLSGRGVRGAGKRERRLICVATYHTWHLGVGTTGGGVGPPPVVDEPEPEVVPEAAVEALVAESANTTGPPLQRVR